MPLVSSKQILYDAMQGGYAVAAFNVENMETVQAVVEGAEQLNSPVIVQTTPSSIAHTGLKFFYANVFTAAINSAIPVALHLDHGDSYDLVVKAIREGYTSLMIDGSKLTFEQNIEITKKVADLAHINGIPVEAELGKVGGKEDNIEVDQKDAIYTEPDQAKEFVEKTGVDYLAIAIGTAHGIYKGQPKLDFERLKEIRELLNIPLVLHGASGVPDEDVKKAIKGGINKVNIATELRIPFTQAIRDKLNDDLELFAPKVYLGAAREAVKHVVMEKIRLCGCDGKA